RRPIVTTAFSIGMIRAPSASRITRRGDGESVIGRQSSVGSRKGFGIGCRLWANHFEDDRDAQLLIPRLVDRAHAAHGEDDMPWGLFDLRSASIIAQTRPHGH